MQNKKAVFSKLGYHIVSQNSNTDDETIEKYKKKLEKFGLDTTTRVEFPFIEDSSEFQYLPEGFNSYDELVSNLAKDVCGDDIRLIETHLKLITYIDLPIPPSKDQIKMVSGWSQYGRDGNFVKSIDAPRDKVLVFDTETFFKGGNLPIIATATGHNRSYIWLAKEFIENIPREEYDQFKLVPLPYTKIIIAHNAMFDVARVTQAYDLPVNIKALDTLSMNMVVSGICSQQRYVQSIVEGGYKEDLDNYEKSVLRNPPKWTDKGCTNSLVSAYNFHVAKEESFWEDDSYLSSDDKELRKIFVDTDSMADFVAMDDDLRLDLVYYAAKDTYYTAKLFRKLYPKYKQSKPHIAALSGHLLLSTSRIPVIKDWVQWINNCERLLNEQHLIASNIIKEIADELFYRWCNGDLTESDIKKDSFYSQLDWSINKVKNTNPEVKYSSFLTSIIRNLGGCIRNLIDETISDLPFDFPEYRKLIKGNYDYIPTWYDKFFLTPTPDIKPTSAIYKILNNHYLLDNRPVKKVADELYTMWSNNKLDLTSVENISLTKLNWKIKRKTIKDDSHSSVIYDKITALKHNIENLLSEMSDKYPSTFKTAEDIFNCNYHYIPEWYSFIYKNPDVIITPKTEISHLLLRLHWDDIPVYKSKDDGWGFFQNSKFFKIQSPGNKDGKNTGNLLGKHFVSAIQDKTLTGEHPRSEDIFNIAIATSFWISTRSRMLERFFMETVTPDGDKTKFNMLCTQNVISGTISGRQTENLFLVLCSPKKNKIGSEAKSRIQAPEGYKILSADFSGQELVLASLYGDRNIGTELGSCVMGYLTLVGSKEKFQDLHSSTAYNLFLKDKGYVMVGGEWFIDEED